KAPHIRIKQYLIECRLLPEDVETSVEKEVAAEVEQAVAAAEAAPQAEPADAFAKVYARPLRAHGERMRPRVPADPRPAERVTADGPDANVIQAVNRTLALAMGKDERGFVAGVAGGKRGGWSRAAGGPPATH